MYRISTIPNPNPPTAFSYLFPPAGKRAVHFKMHLGHLVEVALNELRAGSEPPVNAPRAAIGG